MMGETLLAAPVYRSYGRAIATGVPPGVPSGLAIARAGSARTLAEARSGQVRMPFAEATAARLRDAVAAGPDREDVSTALAAIARRPLGGTG